MATRAYSVKAWVLLGLIGTALAHPALVRADADAAVPDANRDPSPQKLIKPSLDRADAASAPGTSAQTGPAATAATSAAPSLPDKVATPPTAASDLRTQKVLISLLKQAGWFPDLKVGVQAGIVTIQGKTKNAAQLEWLAKTADRLPGVIAVINQTVIETPPVTDLSPAWTELDQLILRAKKALPLIGLALILTALFALAGHYLGRLARATWGRHISNPFLLSTVSKMTMLPVWALFFYLVLRTAGLSGLATTIIGGTGAASLVVGFAFKGIAENYLSGLLLAIRSPFTQGDEIQVDQYSGFVQSLNMRGTTIQDYDGNLVLIPNSIVIGSVIRNKTVNPEKRVLFNLTISFHDSIARARALVLRVLQDDAEVLKKPGPGVGVDKPSASGIDLTITFWFNSARTNGDTLKAKITERIKDELLAQGLTIPDTAREVVFADPLRLGEAAGAATIEPALAPRSGEDARERARRRLSEAPLGGPHAAAADPTAAREAATQVEILRKTAGTGLVRHAGPSA